MYLLYAGVEIEKLGTPTVMINTTNFLELAKKSAISVGVGDPPLVVVPHPISGIDKDKVDAKVDAVMDKIVHVGTKWAPTVPLPPQPAPYPLERVTLKGTIKDVNRMFLEKGWTDGLPIIPPTSELVKEMLAGTSFKPDEVIGVIMPRKGVATVEACAVNAVMAGAKPEHLPVIIAGVRALLKDGRYGWAQTTTGCSTYYCFVQGPIVKEIGMNYSTGAMGPGPGSAVNAVIGRAISMIMRLVGGAYPKPYGDSMTIIGTPNNYSCAFAENEDALPRGWNPLRVDLGYKFEDSVVACQIVSSGQPTYSFNLSAVTAAETLIPLAWHLSYDPAIPGNVLVLLCPEAAARITADGFSKEMARQMIYDNAKIPAYWVTKGPWQAFTKAPPAWLKKEQLDDPNAWIPSFPSPKAILITVVGGPGTHSAFIQAGGRPIIEKIMGATLTKAGR